MAEQISYEYEFTPEELDSLREDVVNLALELEEKEKEKKDIVSEYNEEINQIKASIIDNAHKAHNGKETRYAFCNRIVNHSKGVVEWVDELTGEIMRTDEMTDEDRQMGIEEVAAQPLYEDAGRQQPAEVV